MSKLAVYEKNYGNTDRKIAKYYKNDYVYLKNTRTRIAVGIGTVIVIMAIWAHKIIIGGVDILTIDYRQELIKIGIQIVAVMAIYTVIGSIKETITHNNSTKRLNKYLNKLNQLEQISSKAVKDTKEAARLHGANAVYPRRYY